MLNVVDFLERLGGDASARDASPAEIDRQLAEMQVEPALRAALASGNREALQRLLGARSNVIGFIHPWCCLIDPAMDDEEDEDTRRQRECDDEGTEKQPIPVRDPGMASAA